MSTVYRVVVTREGGAWLANVPDVAGAHTYARSLAGLDAAVREAIAAVLDLPAGREVEAGLALRWEYRTGDARIDEVTARLRARRAELDAAEAELQALTAGCARQLVDANWSVRDAAALLGVSPGRISQVAPRRTTAA